MHTHVLKLVLVVALSLLVAACGAPSAPAAPPAAATPAPVETAPAAQEPAAEQPANTAQEAAQPVSGLRTFVIVPAESRASYLVDEEFFGGALAKLGIPAGLVDVVGSTQEIEGQLQLNLDDLSAALGENVFTVSVNTFTTDQNDRDQWIRRDGPRFNDFPVATFVATAIEGAPAAYTEGEEVSFQLSGDLTVRDIVRPTTFDVTASLNGNTLTGVATARMLMSDFGIDPPNFANTLTVADEFGIEVQITAREE